MSSIFISYSRKDLSVAKKIVSALAESKLDTWIDWGSIPKGEKFEKEIYQGIEGANVFIFLISPESVKSAWCKKEIAHAALNNKRIIPILVQDTDKKLIPIAVSERNWIDCRENQDNLNLAIKQILKTINTDYGWVKYHTQLQLRALDWEKKKDNSQLLRGKELQEAEQQLASVGSNKDPQPTELQRKFIKNSRQYSDRTFRRNTSLIIGVGITILTLGIVGLGFALVAYQKGIVANQAQSTAQVETIARATAQTIAENQEQIAIGKELAIKSQQLPLSGNSMISSGLLAVEAALLNPDLASQQSLSRYLSSSGQPISQFLLEGTIFAADISPDGQLIAVGDSNGLIKVWDINTDNETLKIEFEGSVWDIKFSPSGDKVAAIIGQDLYVLDSVSGNLIFHKGMPTNRYFEPTFNSNEKAIFVFLETPNEGTKLISYDTLTGNEIFTHRLETSNSTLTLSEQKNWAIVTQEFDNQTLLVQVIDWSQDKIVSEREFSAPYNVKAFHITDERVVSAGNTNVVEIWDVNNENKHFSAKVCESAIHSMTISKDKHKIGVGCDEGTLTILDAQNGQIIMSERQNFLNDRSYDPILHLVFNNEGSQIAAGGPSGTVIVWDVETKKEIARMPHDGTVRYIAFVPNRNLVASSGSENTLIIWRPENGLLKVEISQDKSIKAFSFSQEGNLLVASYGDTIKTWDITSHSLLKDISTEGTIIEPAIFSADGELLISGNGHNLLSAFDASTGRLLSSVEHTYCDWIDSISLDINKNIISGCDGGNHFMWDPYNGQVIDDMNISGFPPVLSPNGKLIAYLTESDDYPKKNLVIAKTETKNTVLILEDGNAPIDINYDNSLVAFVNSNYETVKIWDIQNNVEIFSARHDSTINTIEFDPDGRLIITADKGGNIRVWEALTGKEIARLTMPFQVIDLAVSPDNKLILFSSGGVTLYSWKWNIVDQLEEVCNRLPRNFTKDEWNQFIGSDVPYHPTCPNLPVPQKLK